MERQATRLSVPENGEGRIVRHLQENNRSDERMIYLRILYFWRFRRDIDRTFCSSGYLEFIEEEGKIIR